MPEANFVDGRRQKQLCPFFGFSLPETLLRKDNFGNFTIHILNIFSKMLRSKNRKIEYFVFDEDRKAEI
jgi:hypothetical protein